MIKVFLTIGFVMSLVLVSCDANIMSSNSDEDLKPINIVGTYESDDKTYYVRVTKDEDEDEDGYLLEFTESGKIEMLKKPDDGYKYNNDKKSFTFSLSDREQTIDYVLLFEEEGFPMLTADKDKPIKLSPHNEESL